MGIFNTKEFSYLFWIILGLCICLLKPSIRHSFYNLLRAVFVKQIVITYLLAAIYTSLWIAALWHNGLWDTSLLKDTIFWLLLVPSVSIFKINEISKNKHYFKEAIKDNVRLTVLLEFLVGLYDFNIWFELLLLPIALIIGVLLGFAEVNKKYEKVKALLNSFMLLVGLFMTAFALYQIGSHYQDFLKMSTLKEFLLPLFLSLTFLPFIYMLLLYVNYEETFTVINRAINSQELLSYAKKEAIFKFNFDTSGLKRWRHRLFLEDIKTKCDIDRTIKMIKELQILEKNPPVVASNLGWSPYEAKDFLKNKGILTGYYTNNHDNDWFACSEYIELDKEILSNNISYYLNGNKLAVTSLKLILKIFDQSIVNDAHFKLLEYAKSLYNKALNKPMPLDIQSAILKGKEIRLNESIADIFVHKEKWQNLTNGYSIKFEINHKSATTYE